MPTPWQKVIQRFGLTPAQLAAEINRDRTKIVRHMHDETGVISGRDQIALLDAAKRLGVELEPTDLLPVHDEA